MSKQEIEADTNGPRAVERLAYSMKEAAEILGVSYITMHRLIARGLIKSSSALRTKLIPKSELERFLRDSMA
jgi:excisionase family DNA binding protein